MVSNEEFITKVEKYIQETTHSEKERMFLLSLDFFDFQTIKATYGIDIANGLLEKFYAYFSEISNVKIFERVFTDQFSVFATTEEVNNSAIVSEINRYIHTFVTREKENYPLVTLKITCGVYVMESRDVIKAVEGATLARREMKEKGLKLPLLYNNDYVEHLEENKKLELTIIRALRNREFSFFLQPKVDLISGKIVGAEALARHVNTEGDILYPNSFIPIMEENETIISLDYLILEEVCKHIVERQSHNLAIVPISVNLSRRHGDNPETAKTLHKIVSQYDVNPQYIEFELTESVLLEDLTPARNLVDELRSYGYKVSIDDFGSGYAGINIWQELDFDILKLDRSLLQVHKRERNEVIVPNVINVAERLGITIVAEGVENEEQCEYLLKTGCTIGQGYMFDGPMSVHDFWNKYYKLDGYYSFEYMNKYAQQFTSYINNYNKKNAPQNIKNIILVCLCFIFLSLCAVGIFYLFHDDIRQLYIESNIINLDGYIESRSDARNEKLEELTDSLLLFSTIVEQEDSLQKINQYVDQLNSKYDKMQYTYKPKESLNNLFSENKKEYLELLEKGDPAVSEIYKKGDVSYFDLYLPVMVQDELKGVLISSVDADILINTKQYKTSYGSFVETFLIDTEGHLLLGDHQFKEGETIYEHVQETYEEADVEDLRRGIEDKNIRSVRVGPNEMEEPIYYGISTVGYNDWVLVDVFLADTALENLTYIVSRGKFYFMIAMGAIFIMTVAAVTYLLHVKRKRDREKEMYLLLEEFSDTILFNYDCRKDILTFTPNVLSFIRIHSITQEHFSENIESSFLYPGDYSIVRSMVDLDYDKGEGEVRIRMLHPSRNIYFWCLVQYKYIYRKGRIVSVVGKITGIDSQKRQENYLLNLEGKDSLTELYNKAIAVDKIKEYLVHSKQSALIMLHVNHLRKINETYGEATGDKVLIDISQCLRRVFQLDSVIGRFQGNEMIVYLDNVYDKEMIIKKIVEYQKNLKKYSQEKEFKLSTTLGIARYPSDGESYDELLKAAREALNEARKQKDKDFIFIEDIKRQDK